MCPALAEFVSTAKGPATDPHLHVWGWEIPVYLFLGGFTAGIMVLSGWALWKGRRNPRPHATFALASSGLLILGLAAISLGMLALFLDLAHKPYVWRLYLTMKPWSPMSWRSWILLVPAATADFIVADNCNLVADAVIKQRSSYAVGTSAEIAQLEKNFYSYQAGYLKHLYRMNGYNENFESWVSDGVTYDTYYIKFNTYDKSTYQWGDYIFEDSTVIIATPQTQSNGSANPIGGLIETVLEAGLGTVTADNSCITTTSTTTTVWPSTTTTSTLIP